MKYIKTTYNKFINESKINNKIEVFHGGYLEDNISSPLYVTENEYLAQTYGDKLYKFELNLNNKILDLTELKTFKNIKAKIYDNYSELYKKYFNIGFGISEKEVENYYNILKKYKNYEEIEKAYKEKQRSDFWDKVEGLDKYGFNGYYDDSYWALEFGMSDNATKEDKNFINEFMLLYRVYVNMTELNDKSLNEFGNFFVDYCKEHNYDAYKAISSDSSGRNRMIEYCIINLDIIKYIDIVNENIKIKQNITPLIGYHISQNNFNKFDSDETIIGNYGTVLDGLYFLDSKNELWNFGDEEDDIVYKVKIDSKVPFYFNLRTEDHWYVSTEFQELFVESLVGYETYLDKYFEEQNIESVNDIDCIVLTGLDYLNDKNAKEFIVLNDDIITILEKSK